MTQIQKIWKKPTRRDPLDKPEVSWIEIFFDLIFVWAFYNLSHMFGYHLDWTHFLHFLIIGSIVFISWWYYVAYQNAFENDDFSNRVFTFLSMFLIICMIVFIEHAFSTHVIVFSIFYVALRFLYTVMWIRAGLHDRETLAPALLFWVVGVFSMTLWWVGVYIEEYRWLFWLASILVDLLFPVTFKVIRESFSRFNKHHMPERIGTFIMMVIGEVFLSITIGLSGVEDFNWRLLFGTFLSIFILFWMWWIYFENVAVWELSGKVKKRMRWFYLHIPLFLTTLLFSVGVTASFKSHFESGTPSLIIWISLWAFFILSALLQKTLKAKWATQKKSTNIYSIFWIVAGIITIGASIINYNKYDVDFTMWLFVLVSIFMAIFIALSLARISNCTPSGKCS